MILGVMCYFNAAVYYAGELMPYYPITVTPTNM